MDKENKILIQSKAFAIRIIRAYQYLCDEKHEYVMSKQLLRSGNIIKSTKQNININPD